MKKKHVKKWILMFVVLFFILFVNQKSKVAVHGVDELVGEFSSPTGSLKMYIYQGPPLDSIMVDFYVVGEIQYMNTPLGEREVVYYKYHEEFKECYWKDEEHVVINGTEIDIKNPKTWVYDEGM